MELLTQAVGALSRELALVCAADGTVTWADARAAALLGLTLGEPLEKLAPEDQRPKLRTFLAKAAAGQLGTEAGESAESAETSEPWELNLCVKDRPTCLAFRASRLSRAQHGDGHSVLLVGSLVPSDYGNVLEQVNENLQELANLHRQSERQQRELTRRADELQRLNAELAESNKGVRSLHAALDEKAETLQRTAEVKSRVVANVSHEFRTPLHSILGLAKLLLNPGNGVLSNEQEKQVQFIRNSAESLYELVNDLLDLSKAESGKAVLRPKKFLLSEELLALRGMMRPVLPEGSAVELKVEIPEEPLELETDEAKLSQILRNLVSNAAKFTEKGSITVAAERADRDVVLFHVRDTGIGISPEHHERIFEEFAQVESPLQSKVKGTGLGLALARKLAEVLGGTLTVQSAVGVGSTFTVAIPRVHPEVAEMAGLSERAERLDPTRAPVLVLEDDRQTLFLYEKYLQRSGFQVVPVRTVEDARAAMQRIRPAAVVLDVMLEGETSWGFLAELKQGETTRDIPVLVVTITDREQKARALGADEFWLKPVEGKKLLSKLTALAKVGPVEKVLIIDDDEVHRYLLRQVLRGTPYALMEAATGPEGVRLAREEAPHLIFLDFVLGEHTAFDVLDDLKADPRTRDIPVILHTSHQLAEDEQARLKQETAAILSKHTLSKEVAISRIRDALNKAGLGTQQLHGAQHGSMEVHRG
ncbi:response regulator [Aggregicoccus sp. 17bor-14]|nr:response regulator [Simulacricoccus sp. 17bor-14]MRI91003.1 response regulator [Aggregicoccus sp. 17bor-14]